MWSSFGIGAVTRKRLMRLFHQLSATEEQSSNDVVSWSARALDEDKVKRWMCEEPEHILFLSGAKGAGQRELVTKLTSNRPNVQFLDFSHLLDKSDEDFVKGFAAAVNFKPGFSLISWMANLSKYDVPHNCNDVHYI